MKVVKAFVKEVLRLCIEQRTETNIRHMNVACSCASKMCGYTNKHL